MSIDVGVGWELREIASWLALVAGAGYRRAYPIERADVAGATITFRVDDVERQELVARAAREKVNLSDYIRVRLGLRAQGAQGDLDVEIGSELERTLQAQLADHERRLQALEAGGAGGAQE